MLYVNQLFGGFPHKHWRISPRDSFSCRGEREERWSRITETEEAWWWRRIDVSPSCPAVTGACALASSRTSPTFLIRSSPCHGPLAIVTPWPPPPRASSRVSHGLPPTVNQPPLFSSVRQISAALRGWGPAFSPNFLLSFHCKSFFVLKRGTFLPLFSYKMEDSLNYWIILSIKTIKGFTLRFNKMEKFEQLAKNKEIILNFTN